jgi:hypothetical protein
MKSFARILASCFFFLGFQWAPVEASVIQIQIDSPNDGQTVFTDELLVEGRVQSEEDIRAFTVQGERIDLPLGRDTYFSRIVGLLVQGPNRIIVAATTESGKEASHSIQVTYQTVMELEREQRLALAIPDFEVIGATQGSGKLADFIHYFQREIHERDRFRVVEADSRVLSEILRERNVRFSDLADTRFNESDFRLIAADIVLDGQLEERDGSLLARVSAKDVANPERTFPLLEAGTQDKSLESMKHLALILALKLEAVVPRFQSEIIAVDPKILCSLPEGLQPRQGTEVLVFRRGEPITVSSGRTFPGIPALLGLSSLREVRSEYAVLGELRVKEVKIQVGDIVVAR